MEKLTVPDRSNLKASTKIWVKDMKEKTVIFTKG